MGCQLAHVGRRGIQGRQTGRFLRQHHESHYARRRCCDDGMEGEAARASQTATDSEKQISNRLGMGILQLTDILNQLAPGFQTSCDNAKRLIDQIQAAGYVVADNGIVTPPAVSRGGWPTDVPANATPEEAAATASTNATVHSAAGPAVGWFLAATWIPKTCRMRLRPITTWIGRH